MNARLMLVLAAMLCAGLPAAEHCDQRQPCSRIHAHPLLDGRPQWPSWTVKRNERANGLRRNGGVILFATGSQNDVSTVTLLAYNSPLPWRTKNEKRQTLSDSRARASR